MVDEPGHEKEKDLLLGACLAESRDMKQQQEPLKCQGKQLPGYAVPVFNSATVWPREAVGIDAEIGFLFSRLNYSKRVLTTALSNSMKL